MWDNERLHAEEDLPLYVAWRRRQESALADEDAPEVASSSSSSVEPKEVLVMADKQDPKYKSLMQQVIAGVQRNDLLQVGFRCTIYSRETAFLLNYTWQANLSQTFSFFILTSTEAGNVISPFLSLLWAPSSMCPLL